MKKREITNLKVVVRLSEEKVITNVKVVIIFFGIKANLRVHTESMHKKKIQM